MSATAPGIAVGVVAAVACLEGHHPALDGGLAVGEADDVDLGLDLLEAHEQLLAPLLELADVGGVGLGRADRRPLGALEPAGRLLEGERARPRSTAVGRALARASSRSPARATAHSSAPTRASSSPASKPSWSSWALELAGGVLLPRLGHLELALDAGGPAALDGGRHPGVDGGRVGEVVGGEAVRRARLGERRPGGGDGGLGPLGEVGAELLDLVGGAAEVAQRGVVRLHLGLEGLGLVHVDLGTDQLHPGHARRCGARWRRPRRCRARSGSTVASTRRRWKPR